MAKQKTNRKYRDSMFVDLFSEDRDAKKNFLSLYNALHDTNLSLDDTEIKPVRLSVTVYNLNRYAEIPEIDRCAALKEYAEFVIIAERLKRRGVDDYITQAVRICRKRNILADYLERNSKEVENMYWGPYDYETDVRVQREEEREVTKLEAARNLLADGIGTPEQLAKSLNLPLEQVQELAQELALEAKPQKA